MSFNTDSARKKISASTAPIIPGLASPQQPGCGQWWRHKNVGSLTKSSVRVDPESLHGRIDECVGINQRYGKNTNHTFSRRRMMASKRHEFVGKSITNDDYLFVLFRNPKLSQHLRCTGHWRCLVRVVENCTANSSVHIIRVGRRMPYTLVVRDNCFVSLAWGTRAALLIAPLTRRSNR